MRVDIDPDGYDVVIVTDAHEGDEHVHSKEWRATVPR